MVLSHQKYFPPFKNLSEQNQNCFRPSDYPYNAALGSVGVYMDNRALVCGGAVLPSTTTNQCFYYSAGTDVWTEAFNMTTVRELAAGVLLTESEFWITGGGQDLGDEEGYHPLFTTEICTFDGGCRAYVDLPEAAEFHNIVKVNETHFIFHYYGKAWMFDRSIHEWIPLPDTLVVRDFAQAELVEFPDGHKVVMLAGGSLTKSTEMFDLTKETWVPGDDLPVVLNIFFGGSTVQFEKTMYIFGGIDGVVKSSVIKYDTVLGEWTQLPTHLTMVRDFSTAILMPEDYLHCNALK